MEDNLKDVALIDNYLNNELSERELAEFKRRFDSDLAFQMEVEKYQAIYEELEQIETKKLKKRLKGYHRSYEEDHKKNPRKIGRLLWIGGSIAAMLCIGWVLTLSQNNFIENPKFPKDDSESVVIDSLQFDNDSIKKFEWAQDDNDTETRSENEPVIVKSDPYKSEKQQDSSRVPPIPIDKTQLALSGHQRLAQYKVKKIEYPSRIRYQFDGEILQLYADPSLGSLEWKIFKKDSSYLLAYGAKKYDLAKTARIRNLTELTPSKSSFRTLFNRPLAGEATEERITLKLKDHRAMGTKDDNLQVHYNERQVGKPSYFFTKINDSIHLMLNIALDPKETNVYIVREKNKRFHYLRIGEALYALNPLNNKETSLIPVNILTDENARLLIEKKAVEKTVFRMLD